MGDFANNEDASFTKWLVGAGLLREPFVLIDVGVQGGHSPRWTPLGDYLVVHGFDPIAEIIRDLVDANRSHPNRHYHCMALGNADGEETFFFNPKNPTASSMYSQGISRFDIEHAAQQRRVPIRRLDTLATEGLIAQQADFIKIDVEGYEKEVILGAEKLLSRALGMHCESNFGVSPLYPKSHFAAIAELALEAKLQVFDLTFDRIPRASFQRALVARGGAPISGQDLIGKPGTLDVLFCRDVIDEVDHPENYSKPSQPLGVDQLLKMLVIYELHAINDIALDTVERFTDLLGTRIDVGRAIHFLANPHCCTNSYRNRYEQRIKQYEQRIKQYEQSTSWQITAPLRWAKGLLASKLPS